MSRFLDPRLFNRLSQWFICPVCHPLDPPCGGGAGQPPNGPQPDDNNGVFEYPDGEAGTGENVRTHNPWAVDYVWFESEANIVTLESSTICQWSHLLHRPI